MKEAVVFVACDLINQKVLVEKRSLVSSYAPNQIVFPGGMMEEVDLQSPEKTLHREIYEEIGIFPTRYHSLSDVEHGNGNYLLHPFLILEWIGNIPNTVLDKGNPLLWVNLSELQKSPLEEVMAIAILAQTKLTDIIK